MRYTIDALALLYTTLEHLPAYVTTDPPTDLPQHLPALIVETSAPTGVTNLSDPRAGITCTASLNALARSRAEASALCDLAYGRVWEARGERSEFGWISGVRDLQQPHRVVSTAGADNVFQFTAAVNLVLRRDR